MLQPVYEDLDRGNACARFFFADFSKGFDRIDHHILMKELEKLDTILLYLIGYRFPCQQKTGSRNWRNFVRLEIPKWWYLVPKQGTKLGVILFSVMKNNLMSDWYLRSKFVDDTAALEVIPRSSISYLNNTVDELHQFSINQNISLNSFTDDFRSFFKTRLPSLF